MGDCYQFDPELGYMPAIPEPFWERSWRTWMLERPMCVECGKLLKDRREYSIHWVLNHGAKEAEARKDNKELDGTDAAHPAWWRGNDAGVAQVCAQINAILDGADVFGTASEPWESTRRRVAEARKNLERLREVLEAGKADRWAATVGNTETNAFRPSGWVVRAEAALALTPASTKPTALQPRQRRKP